MEPTIEDLIKKVEALVDVIDERARIRSRIWGMIQGTTYVLESCTYDLIDSYGVQDAQKYDAQVRRFEKFFNTFLDEMKNFHEDLKN